MQKNTLNRTKNTVSATYLPYTAYKAAHELATALKGEIGKTADGNFKATFNSVETAKKFVTEWTANYNANRKVEVAPAPKSAPAQKPKASKGKTDLVTVTLDGVEYTVPASALVQKPTKASSTKKATAKKATAPKKSKGVAFDFGKIKGKTTSEKNRALHKELVKMGLKDSRTPEYMSVWNARPWA